MDLLRERGLKGKPSVTECRKIKKKYETEKEVSELNTSNIITSKGLCLIVYLMFLALGRFLILVSFLIF